MATSLVCKYVSHEVLTGEKANGDEYPYVEVSYRVGTKPLETTRIFLNQYSQKLLDQLNELESGQVITVELKVNGRFKNWNAITLGATGEKETASANGKAAKANAGAASGDMESNKDIIITRQSSITRALEFLIAAKKEVTLENVRVVAGAFEKFVFHGFVKAEKKAAAKAPPPPPVEEAQDEADLQSEVEFDDIPF